MPMIDPFRDGFKLTELTAAINLLPNKFRKILDLGLFRPEPARTENFMVEVQKNSVALIPTVPWGTRGYAMGEVNRREIKPLIIPRTVIDESVHAKDVSGVRRFGASDNYETLAEVLNRKQQTMKDSIDLTREYRMMGSLKGKVYDADGVTVLFDNYDFFGVTPRVDDFDLGTASNDVGRMVREVKRHLEDNAHGETFSSIRVLCSSSFFDKFIAHKSVKEIYLGQAAGIVRYGGDPRAGFTFQDVTFEEYRAKVKRPDGTMVSFLDDGEALAVPMGTRETFLETLAPAVTNSTVNTVAQTYYSWVQPTKWDDGYDVRVESNTLPIVTRPELVVSIITTT